LLGLPLFVANGVTDSKQSRTNELRSTAMNKCNVLQHKTMQRNATQRNANGCDTKQLKAIRCTGALALESNCYAMQKKECTATQYNAMQANANEYKTTQRKVMQTNMIHCNLKAMQCTALCIALDSNCHAMQCTAMPCNALQLNRLQHNATHTTAIHRNANGCKPNDKRMQRNTQPQQCYATQRNANECDTMQLQSNALCVAFESNCNP